MLYRSFLHPTVDFFLPAIEPVPCLVYQLTGSVLGQHASGVLEGLDQELDDLLHLRGPKIDFLWGQVTVFLAFDFKQLPEATDSPADGPCLL